MNAANSELRAARDLGTPEGRHSPVYVKAPSAANGKREAPPEGNSPCSTLAGMNCSCGSPLSSQEIQKVLG